VDTRPLERLVGAEALPDRLEVRALRPDLRVAVHASLRGRNPGERRLLDRGVAVATVDADRADVVRVGELDRLLAGDRLLGRVRGRLEVVEKPEEDREEENRPEDRE